MAMRRLAFIVLFSSTLLTAFAQSPAPLSGSQVKAAAGDQDDDATGSATDLSPAFTRRNIQKAMRKVADWQLKKSASRFNADWTYAPLYLGLLATSDTTHDPKYHDAVLTAAQAFDWKLWANRDLFADDEAIAQVYEQLYLEQNNPQRLADTTSTFERLLLRPDNPQKDLWWWCDALFMAPAGLARLSAITGNHAYIDKMNAEWSLTTAHLYDAKEHLYFRDATYLQKTEANGRPIFWARGNGWVMAGTVNVLKALPVHDPSRARYVQLLRDMSDRFAGLQQPDGLWHSGLLDQSSYDMPEISGSAFFVYAIAWGINQHLLDRKRFLPVVIRARSGLTQHIYADGRLGCVQPIGGAPGSFKATSSYVYGVGAFLLGASEAVHLAH